MEDTTANSEQTPQRKQYESLHPEIYRFSWDFVDPRLRNALRAKENEAIFDILNPRIPGIFSFPCLTPEFCAKFTEELRHIQRSGVSALRRPNSMNNYGATLNSLGFKHFFDDFLKEVIIPLASVLYKEEGGAELKHHHSFTVKYQPGGDVKLKTHTDNSDITLNVCLTPASEFTGGTLFFKGLHPCSIQRIPASMHRYKREEQEYEVGHELGVGLLHLGRHVHGAHPITSGARSNIIVWCRKEPFPQ